MRRLAAWYFGGHAVLDVLWWIAVASSPHIRGWFELDAANHRVLNSFVLPDLVLLGVLSMVAAIALVREWPSARVLAAVVTGGSAYATLYIIWSVALGGHGWMGAVAMSIETAIMALFVVTVTS